MRNPVYPALALLAVAQVSLAQVPPRRAHHTLFYDPVGQRVLLSGGSTPLDSGRRFEFFNDLWSFDGTRWTSLPSSGARVSGTRIEADARGRLVSFGGFSGSAAIGDVRVLENDQWRTLGAHPTLIAAEPGFVFDSARNRFVAFGGSGASGLLGETWEFDGSSWMRRPGAAPPSRAAHAMVFDARRGRTVVFGGMGGAAGGRPTPLGDTWEFDGTTWRQVEVTGPSARVSPGVAYDSKRGLVMLFGGSNQQGFLNDLWSWDGSVWTKLAEDGPDPRAMGYIAYDKKRDRLVLFGGRKGYPNGDMNDTWEWNGVGWHRVPVG